MRINPRPVYEKPTDDDRRQDREYLAWLKTQPSACSGLLPTVPAHYRTAENSGTGTKPLFSAIPLTFDEHAEQHRIGTFAFKPRSWWIEKVNYYVEKWRAERAVQTHKS